MLGGRTASGRVCPARSAAEQTIRCRRQRSRRVDARWDRRRRPVPSSGPPTSRVPVSGLPVSGTWRPGVGVRRSVGFRNPDHRAPDCPQTARGKPDRSPVGADPTGRAAAAGLNSAGSNSAGLNSAGVPAGPVPAAPPVAAPEGSAEPDAEFPGCGPPVGVRSRNSGPKEPSPTERAAARAGDPAVAVPAAGGPTVPASRGRNPAVGSGPALVDRQKSRLQITWRSSFVAEATHVFDARDRR